MVVVVAVLVNVETFPDAGGVAVVFAAVDGADAARGVGLRLSRGPTAAMMSEREAVLP